MFCSFGERTVFWIIVNEMKFTWKSNAKRNLPYGIWNLINIKTKISGNLPFGLDQMLTTTPRVSAPVEVKLRKVKLIRKSPASYER